MYKLSKVSDILIISAMTSDNHPCEILSDLYSISRLRDDYKNLIYTFVGEKTKKNSWIAALKVLKFKLNHICVAGNEIEAYNDYYTFYTELDDVLKTTDIIITDSLSKELRNTNYFNKYQITLEGMKTANDGSLLNPYPPFFRGEVSMIIQM